MKKFLIPLILLLCLSLTACGNMSQEALDGQAGDGSGGSFFDKIFDAFDNFSIGAKVDIFSEPKIVLDEDAVEIENRYDETGKLVGYYRKTLGKNCGVSGCMLFEILDLDKNVLNSYQPTFAGQSLQSSYFDGQLKELWETDSVYGKYNPNYNNNTYYFFGDGESNPYAYLENRNGASTRLDFYDEHGKVMKTLTPSDPEKVFRVGVQSDAQGNEYIYVSEVFEEYEEETGNIGGYLARELYYDMSCNLLCEFGYSNIKNPTRLGYLKTHIEVKNASGKVVRNYEYSPSEVNENDLFTYACDLSSIYYPALDIVLIEGITGYDENTKIPTFSTYEYFDLSDNKIIFRLDKTYQEGNNFITQYSYVNGKIIATGSLDKAGYLKFEMYDKKGNLKELIEAPAGEMLDIRYEPSLDIGTGEPQEWIYIYSCDAKGNLGSLGMYVEV